MMNDVSDAVLIYGFGGPEGPADVMPFLRRVTAGRGVPDARLALVAAQYDAVGGVSPYNALTRRLADDVAAALLPDLRPIYVAYRNTAPFLPEVLGQMVQHGVSSATVFVPSAYSSESSCLRYRQELAVACDGLDLTLWKIPPFFAEPAFIAPIIDEARKARLALGDFARLVCTAHSLPVSMAERCDYVAQLNEVALQISETCGYDGFDLVFQSRSGSPSDPWLGPDISDHLRTLAADGITDVVIAPIGFTHDHMEVIYDLDIVALRTAEEVGIRAVRIATAGADPRFPEMVAQFVLRERPVGQLCGLDCCAAQKLP